MKRVYFIRHGQTLMNRKHIHQSPEEPLTDIGTQQAHDVAQLLKNKPYTIDTIISSSYVRARETASIVADTLDLPYVVEECVREFRRPDPLYGKPHNSLASLQYLCNLFIHREDPNWDDHKAENMFNVRNRVTDVKHLLANTPGQHIAVISHAIFIDMFVQMVCADRSLHFVEFFKAMVTTKKLPNTGIVAFELDDTAPPETCAWWLLKKETNEHYLRVR